MTIKEEKYGKILENIGWKIQIKNTMKIKIYLT
jgi:hypothetical protein